MHRKMHSIPQLPRPFRVPRRRIASGLGLINFFRIKFSCFEIPTYFPNVALRQVLCCTSHGAEQCTCVRLDASHRGRYHTHNNNQPFACISRSSSSFLSRVSSAPSLHTPCSIQSNILQAGSIIWCVDKI
jgi:hypothetical protein